MLTAWQDPRRNDSCLFKNYGCRINEMDYYSKKRIQDETEISEDNISLICKME